MVFFFNDTATTEIYTLSLHDALPIYPPTHLEGIVQGLQPGRQGLPFVVAEIGVGGARGDDDVVVRDLSVSRSEEHTSELQSRQYLVCRLLLEKKKSNQIHIIYILRTF